MSDSTAPMTHGVNIDALKSKPASETDQATETALTVQDLKLFYGEKEALKGINMTIPKERVTAFIGPSGCGKSTLLRCFNRMNDLVDGVRIEGRILLHDKNIYDRDIDIAAGAVKSYFLPDLSLQAQPELL